MSVKYLFRMDDITWDMNYDMFEMWRDMFIRHNVKPLIGVIPSNKDEKLINYSKQSRKLISQFDFWNEIRCLQSDYDWSVALHGYDHVYTTKESGILHINERSEFAGVSYELQYNKIKKGLEILKSQGINCNTFMSPAHSFDVNTIKALADNGIEFMTDGHSLFPYYIENILLVPQIWSFPKKSLLGVSTFCIHPNTTSIEKLYRFEKFIENNNKNLATWEEVCYMDSEYKRNKFRIANALINPILKTELKAVKLLARVR